MRLPPVQHRKDGKERQVGIELEFSGIPLDRAAIIIKELYGGDHTRENNFSQKVTGTKFGNFTLELDAQALKDKNYEKELKKLGINLDKLKISGEVEDLVEKVSNKLVPYEIAAPPVPISKIEELEDLRKKMQQKHAKGTESSIFFAFGLHINPEIPDLEVNTILSYLRSFILLEDWIIKESGTDFTRRRLTSFIDDFPQKYKMIILNESYNPDINELVQDYKTYNNTRNRPLDLYPLFAHIDRGLIKGMKEEALVKPRPALHYRLPNCNVQDREWSIEQEWDHWVDIEELAYDRDRLRKMSLDYLSTEKKEWLQFRSKWIKKTAKWLS